VCAALFGGPEPEVRYLARTEAMEQAMRAAKESLPTARERFLAGDLPPHARLMVKYEINGGRRQRVSVGVRHVVEVTGEGPRQFGRGHADGPGHPGRPAGRD
jgi:hypothetical protein